MSNNHPLLMGELTETERISLAALKQHPGYAVLEKIFMAACRRATEDMIKLDPAEEGYERKLKALQSRARERNEFSLLILRSIDWQIAAQQPERSEPEHNRIVRQLDAIRASKE
jgi:hypothetical protein